jgi:threonine dehydrogenase-like Zn-dependent dehydrogenase
MAVRPVLIVAVRAVAGLALVLLGAAAINRSAGEVTVTFPAAETRNLSADVVIECSGSTSFDVQAGGAVVGGHAAYEQWRSQQAEGSATVAETEANWVSACDAARDSRLIDLVWLVAGALACGILLLALAMIPTSRPEPSTSDSREPALRG